MLAYKTATMLLKLNLGAGEAWQSRSLPIIRSSELRGDSITFYPFLTTYGDQFDERMIRWEEGC